MTNEVKELKEKAEYYVELLQLGVVTIEKAKENIMPYINLVNEKSIELAKKHGVKPRKISFSSFVR